MPEKYRQLYQRPNITATTAQFYGMIANIDENVGRLRKRLTELGLADDTVLVFMIDNASVAKLTIQPICDDCCGPVSRPPTAVLWAWAIFLAKF